jgi:hypothetical protein
VGQGFFEGLMFLLVFWSFFREKKWTKIQRIAELLLKTRESLIKIGKGPFGKRRYDKDRVGDIRLASNERDQGLINRSGAEKNCR